MALGARLGDGVTSIVGPSIERLRWARDTILEARQATGLAIDGLRLGASAVIAVNENRSIARDLARPMTSVQSRFAIMHGRVNGPASDQLRSDLMKVRTSYDMTHHAEGKSDQAEVMSEEFIDAFAIAGPPGYCIERIQEIMALSFALHLLDRVAQQRPRGGAHVAPPGGGEGATGPAMTGLDIQTRRPTLPRCTSPSNRAHFAIGKRKRAPFATGKAVGRRPVPE